MAKIEQLAQQAERNLLQNDEEQLFELLGIRARAMADDLSVAGSFEPRVVHNSTTMGPLDGVRALGRRIFNRWNVEAHKLICGGEIDDKEDREKLQNAFGMGDVTVAAVVSALLVTYFGLAPAIAAVIAAILAKRFLKPSYDEFCQYWKENLPSK
jgi:hypothetical protein